MKIAVILGSTRKVRRGARVATWLMAQLPQYKDAEFELLDLRDYPLPFYAEDDSPDSLEHGYSTNIATQWASKIGEADGFIIIASEYNHGPTAVLKNALDYVYNEWNKKPVAFVGYATGSSGAMRAIEQLRTITLELQMAPMHEALHITNVLDIMDEHGNLLQGHADKKLKSVVEELLWWANALKAARDRVNTKA